MEAPARRTSGQKPRLAVDVVQSQSEIEDTHMATTATSLSPTSLSPESTQVSSSSALAACDFANSNCEQDNIFTGETDPLYTPPVDTSTLPTPPSMISTLPSPPPDYHAPSFGRRTPSPEPQPAHTTAPKVRRKSSHTEDEVGPASGQKAEEEPEQPIVWKAGKMLGKGAFGKVCCV